MRRPRLRIRGLLPLLVLTSILLVALATRVINLNYNTPFNDEAIYIVVGKLGLFQKDWQTYGAANWMAGWPYLYPSLAALGYVFGGIVGSRFLNVLLGMLTFEIIYLLTLEYLPSGKHSHLSGLIAATLIAATPVSFYVSRLATYDMPSFFLFFLGLLFLETAHHSSSLPGKYYLLSALALSLGVLTKYVILPYIPLVVVYSFSRAFRHSQRFSFWKYYFFLPLSLALGIYGLANINNLIEYLAIPTSNETYQLSEMLTGLWQDVSYMLVFWAIGSLGLIFSRRFLAWLTLTFAAVWIALPHLILHRAPWSLTKHVFLSLGFISILAGLGIYSLVSRLPRSLYFSALATLTTGVLIFWLVSFQQAQRFNTLWPNTAAASDFLTSHSRLGSKILTQTGDETILALYDQNPPFNITTFDWIGYRQLPAHQAYAQAVSDGYFDLIELLTPDTPTTPEFTQVGEIVRQNLPTRYRLSYSDSAVEIYQHTNTLSNK
jgi:4-amino-4-deoxy-L-arabinose transferase-like glycosyltransferase